MNDVYDWGLRCPLCKELLVPVWQDVGEDEEPMLLLYFTCDCDEWRTIEMEESVEFAMGLKDE